MQSRGAVLIVGQVIAAFGVAELFRRSAYFTDGWGWLLGFWFVILLGQLVFIGSQLRHGGLVFLLRYALYITFLALCLAIIVSAVNLRHDSSFVFNVFSHILSLVGLIVVTVWASTRMGRDQSHVASRRRGKPHDQQHGGLLD